MAAEISLHNAGAAGPARIAAALKRASETTGVGFDYLMKTAMRESSLNAKAQAATSSAAGLFQFIEQTWLGAVKTYGARHGLGAYASDITRAGDGTFRVANSVRREEILNLRFDAEASAALAGELAGENKRALESRLGRAVSAADLYAAHFLGPAGAAKLLGAAAGQKAADLLPAAAKANAHVFYDGARAKTVGEVVASFAKSMGAETVREPASVFAKAGNEAVGVADAAQTKIRGRGVANDRLEAKSLAGQREISRIRPATRLSMLAMSVLQALDPTRLASPGRSDNSRERT